MVRQEPSEQTSNSARTISKNQQRELRKTAVSAQQREATSQGNRQPAEWEKIFKIFNTYIQIGGSYQNWPKEN